MLRRRTTTAETAMASDQPAPSPFEGLSIEKAASINQFVMENPGVTPDEVLDILELDEQYRESVEDQCAITRMIRFGASHGGAFDDEGLDWENVEWSDVADWPVAKSPGWS